MDVTNPELIWIDGRCYRVNETQYQVSRNRQKPTEYVEEDLYGDDDDDDECYEVQPIGSKFKSSFHLCNVFYPFLIGSKGATRKRLEKETNVQIKVPRIGDPNENVEILGYSYKDVIACRRTIDLIVSGAKNKLDFTHFVSFPFNTDEIVENVEKFQNEIISDDGIHVDPMAFLTAKKIHQTVFPIVLVDNEDRAAAAQCFTECYETIVKPFLQSQPNGKITVTLSGVDIINDDPSKVSVLFAKIHSEEMQEMCNKILAFFIKKRLITDKYNQVKMHATLINTRYQNAEADQSRRPDRIFFDARKILETYKDYHFGTMELSEMHLSIMGTNAANGYYESSAVINFS